MSTLKTGRPSRKEKAIALIKKTEDISIRMNVNMPKSFYRKIKRLALDKDITITELVKKALSEYMSK